MAVDPEEYRRAMRQWATGVSVVTTSLNGVRHGMTVNSFTSVSLTPPLLLVSLERSTRTHRLIKQAGFFGVTILSHSQQEVSDCFAGRHTELEDRFYNLKTHVLVTGAPFVDGGLAYVDCKVVSSYEVGTHTLFIGEVLALELTDLHQPLIYYNRTYKGLQK
ncbi:MAG: flavin reductase family protein [Omnitrophica WOR_2 bacterium]